MRALFRSAAALALLGLLTGCVSMPAPTYQSSIDVAGALATPAPRTSLEVGGFDAAAGVENRSLSVRGSQLQGGGADGSFSGYLRDALATELRNTGRLKDGSPLRISGTLLRNDMKAGSVSIGTATVGARFAVEKNGEKIYERSFEVVHTWESSFVGAVAIPAAMDNYSTAVQKLLFKLTSDPEFVQATASD